MNRPQPRTKLVLTVSALALLAACENNIGRIWDRDPTPGDGDGSTIEVVAVGGRTKEGRPRVVEAFPQGQGWPISVPIVVVFDESISPASVTPDEGTPRVFLRATAGASPTPGVPGGAAQTVTTDTVFLAGDTAVVLRPLQPLLENATYEVVVDPQLRDVDGVPKGGGEPEVVATFQPNEDDTLEDGEIVTILPADRDRQATRETPVWVIFDRPVQLASVTPDMSVATDRLRVEAPGGVAVEGDVEAPVQLAGIADTRLVRFLPDDSFAGDTEFSVVFDEGIAFGDADGELVRPRGGVGARFTTVGPTAPLDLRVGNPSAGFPDRVNRQNLAGLMVDVDLDAGVLAGNRVIARIYGGDPSTDAEGDLDFVEASVEVPVDGPTTVSVPFGDRLGTADALRLEEGELAFVARVEGNGSSGFTTTDPDEPPLIDVTPPSITGFAPALANEPTSIVTDQESLSVFGLASEPLGGGELTVLGQMAQLFGADDQGGFVFAPIPLGPRSEPASYMLTVTDRSGNVAPNALTGVVRQRGAITGAFVDTLTVEAWDEGTFAGILGATVVIEPGLPTSPPAGSRRVASTGADGRAVFTGLAPGPYTVTIVAPGYDLTTLLETPAAFCSLPLRPTTVATATMSGVVQFVPAPGRSALVGSNAFADPALESVPATGSVAAEYGPVAIRPGRPQALTAFVGDFEPRAVPTFASWACLMCGRDGLTPSAPFAPSAPGAEVEAPILTGIPNAATAKDIAGTYDVDFAASTGFGVPANDPTVRVMAGLAGIGGMTLFGVGFATPVAGESYRIAGTFSLAATLGLAPFSPLLWVSTQAVDGAGNVARHRRLIIDPNFGTTFPTVPAPGIPTVEAPAGPATGAPLVRYADVLDATTLIGGFGVTTITATDAAGRAWRIFRHDVDGAGAIDEVQLPVLTGVATGLAPGAWTVSVQNDLFFTLGMSAGSWLLEERKHQQVTWARAVGQTFTVQ